MAKLSGGLPVTGTLGDVSIYRMRGSEKLVVRAKGGASKQRIKKAPEFAETRKNNSEWSGCVEMAKKINWGLFGVKHLADFSYIGQLTAICKSVQLDDAKNKKGQRSISLSKNTFKLEGFGYNKYNAFDTVLRHPLQCEINKTKGSVVIQMPEIVPELNLRNPLKQPFCRFVFAFAAVADVVYNEKRKSYLPVVSEQLPVTVLHTQWTNANERQEAKQLLIELPGWKMKEGVSLLLAVGAEFGQPVVGGEIRFTKYAGAAKVLRVV